MPGRFSLSFPLLLLAATFCCGQTSDTPGTDTTPASVSGHLSNAMTGESIAGATVRLQPFSALSVPDAALRSVSNAEGAFQFTGVPPGSYLIRAEKDGFIPTPLDRRATFLVLRSGEARNDVSSQLTPQATAGGTVQLEDGTAVGGAHITALRLLSVRGKLTLQLASTAEADKSGRFQVGKLSPGRYYFVADPPDNKQPPTRGTREAGEIVRTIYPRGLLVADGSPVDVDAGGNLTDLAIVAQRMRTFAIRGKIADVDSRDDLKLSLKPEGDVQTAALSHSTKIAANGTWAFEHVAPGAYVVELTGSSSTHTMATHEQRNGLLAHVPVEVEDHDLNDVVVSVEPPIQITGSVSVEEGSTVNFAGLRAFARPLSEQGPSEIAQSFVAANGSFVLRNLRREPYLFNLFAGSSGLYVKAITLNNQDVLNKEVDLSSVSGGQLNIVTSTSPGSISGTVQDTGVTQMEPDNKAVRVAIVLIPAQLAPDASNVFMTYARPGAAFKFDRLAPGVYRLLAADQADPNIWRNNEFLNQVSSSATTVTVSQNSQTTVQIAKLSPTQIQEAIEQAGLGLQ
jgi:hypothetical protein